MDILTSFFLFSLDTCTSGQSRIDLASTQLDDQRHRPVSIGVPSSFERRLKWVPDGAGSINRNVWLRGDSWTSCVWRFCYLECYHEGYHYALGARGAERLSFSRVDRQQVNVLWRMSEQGVSDITVYGRTSIFRCPSVHRLSWHSLVRYPGCAVTNFHKFLCISFIYFSIFCVLYYFVRWLTADSHRGSLSHGIPNSA